MREILGTAKTVRELLKTTPGFLRFKEQSGLPFVPLTQFKKADVESRSQLYTKIAERIWKPDDLLLFGDQQ